MNKSSNRIADLSAEQQRVILAQLLRKKAGAPVASNRLSHGQQSLWFLYKLAPHSAAYNLTSAVRIRSDLNIPALERAFQALINRHPTLRTTFAEHNGEPVQRVGDLKFQPQVIDASTWSQATLDTRLTQEMDRPFNLEQGPVLRVTLFKRSAEEHILVLTVHHISADFWSLDIMLDELRVLYGAEKAGIRATLPAPGLPYSEFVRWQENLLSGSEGERLWAYWQTQLAGKLPLLHLPTDFPRPKIQTYHGRTHTFRLPDELTLRLKELGKAQGVTLYMTLLAAFQTLLYRYTGQEDIPVGSPMAGRGRLDLERSVGHFVNPIVLHADPSSDPSFQQFLDQVRLTVAAGLEHQDYPFPLLVKRLHPARDASHPPLFQVMFIWDKPRQRETQAASPFGPGNWSAAGNPPGAEIETIASGQRGAAFDLTLTIFELGNSLSAALKYNVDLFREETIARMAGHFLTLLEGIAANPEKHLSQLPLLTRVEHDQLLLAWNDTQAECPRDRCIHQLFESQVEHSPEAVALVTEQEQLTYGELDRRANQLAHYLRTLGVGPETLVAICVERSPAMLVGLLGILKAGGAYLPLDPAYPKERLGFMLEDAQAPILLTQEKLLGVLPRGEAYVVCIDRDWPAIARASAEKCPSQVTPDNLAYVIYTSGSTGRPKGVQIPHRAVVNFLTSMHRQPGLSKHDVLLAVTSLSFDIAALELFLPLVSGARVVLVSRESAADSAQLARLLTDSEITVVQATPVTWRLLLEAGWQGNRQLKILCGGEALSRELANRLLEKCAELYNLYGPTETTIWSAVHRVRFGSGPVPIGRPISNTQIYLLNSHLHPAPIGVAGELHIGGAGVARGYLNRAELSAAKFIRNPFSDDPEARLYKTGDLARYLLDGNIEFLGRIDQQVKLHGFRVEPGEIETVLSRHPDVRESVVVLRDAQQNPGEQHLVAYIVPDSVNTQGGGEAALSIGELRHFLREKLPEYMVPSAFVFLNRLPLTANGKVDRAALPAPDATRPRLDQAFAAPRNPVEQLLARIWSQVLEIEAVGIHDNFFDLGGASTQVLQIIAKSVEAGIQLTPEMFFAHQSIAELAAEYNATHLVQETRRNTIIESIGVYLPAKAVSTREIIAGCKRKVEFPLEQVSGITYRRVVGEAEFSIDLAKEAVTRCLAGSKYGPEDVDLLICCNISRYDGPDFQFSFEPDTSVKLKKHFGFSNALVFDITNACTGMFTGIYIVDALLKAGAIRVGMVVSGEYTSHLAKTAQLEIEGYMDARLACLTLGDAGAALILEQSDSDKAGFHELEMYTLGRFSPYCIAKATDREHGGAIMLTDSLPLSDVTIKQAVMHSAHVLERAGWSPDSIQHLIMHQTSKTTLDDGVRATNNLYKRKICHSGNVIYNLAERGNTATTSHFVAVMDSILNHKINADDNVVFSITGSGLTIGTALYTFNDLPDRVRQNNGNMQKAPNRPGRYAARSRQQDAPRIRIESVGIIPEGRRVARDTIGLAKVAAEDCLEKSSYPRSELDLLIFAGVYRNDFVSEPAIASMVAGALGINDNIESQEAKKTFAFDVFNSAIGFLNACYVATELIRANKHKTVMVVASEIENNVGSPSETRRGIQETGSAVILDAAANGKIGFGNFIFRYFTSYIDAFTAHTGHFNGKPTMVYHQAPRLLDYYLEYIPGVVHELLGLEGLGLEQIDVILPPQISSAFTSNLSSRLNVARDKFVDLAQDGQDYFSSSVPYSLNWARETNRVQAGTIGLIISVGTGIQVGCAIYYF